MDERIFNGYLADEIRDNEIRKQGPHEEPLTERQLKIANYLSYGFSVEMLAEELCISPKTVLNHITNARTRMGTKTRTHLIAKLIRQGLI